MILHKVHNHVSGKAGAFKPADSGGGQTGINSGNGWGIGRMHGTANGDGIGERRNEPPRALLQGGVAQLSLLCQVMGEEA